MFMSDLLYINVSERGRVDLMMEKEAEKRLSNSLFLSSDTFFFKKTQKITT